MKLIKRQPAPNLRDSTRMNDGCGNNAGNFHLGIFRNFPKMVLGGQS